MILKHNIKYLCMLLATSVIFFSTTENGFAAEVSVTLNTKQITISEAAILTISVKNAETTSRPILPKVKGLTFTGGGQSSQSSLINGRYSSSIDYTYYIVPEKPGNYVIPSFEVKADGKSFTTEPQSFKVLKSARTARTRRNNNSSRETKRQYAFIRVTPLSDKVYVGQYIPIKIDAYFNQNYSMGLSTAPQVINSAFTLTKLSDRPDQTQKVYRGKAFTVVTWYAGVTPVKAGKYDFGIKLGATVQIRVRSSQRSRSRSLFGSFFDDPFVQTVEKKIDVTSTPHKVNVLPLPRQNKPKHFTGAIGKFTIAASTSTDTVMVGDPITMKIIISGEGNFARINSPIITDGTKWKSYKPNATFSPKDIVGFEGKKIFEQALIPQDERADAIPSFDFTYFDPSTGKYKTVKTQRIPLTITHGKDEPRRYVQVDSIDEAKDSKKNEKKDITDEDGLAPINIELGECKQLSPAWQQQWFILINGASLIIIIISFIIYHKRTNGNVDESKKRRKRLSRQVIAAVNDVDKAMKKNDTAAFFNNCIRAIQLHIADKLGVSADTVTLNEVTKIYEGDADKLVELFEMADAVKYSGQSIDTASMKEWRSLLDKELKELGGSVK